MSWRWLWLSWALTSTALAQEDPMNAEASAGTVAAAGDAASAAPGVSPNAAPSVTAPNGAPGVTAPNAVPSVTAPNVAPSAVTSAAPSVAPSVAPNGEGSGAGDERSREPDSTTEREPSVPPAWESEVVSTTLDNGLLARVQQRRDTAFAAVCVTFAVGNSDDPEGYEGLAHLTEHLMFTPTREVPEGFGRYVEALGARHVNAMTSRDDTEYCTEVPSEALDAVLFAEAMRMGFLLASLAEDDVERERAAVLHEQRERGRTGLGIEVHRTLLNALWREGHPYSREMEDERSAERIQLEHVRWFFQRWYGPANATIAVVSAEDPAQVQARIAHYFGALRGSTPPARPHPELPAPDSARFVVRAPMIRDQLFFAWTSPRYHERDDAALDLVADVVEERLGELFEDDENVRSVSAYVWSASRGSTFEITILGEDETDLAPYVARVHEVLGALRDQGPTRTELNEARRRWDRSLGTSRRSPLTAAKRLASSRVHGRPELAVRDARYGSLDDDAILAALRRWLRPEREVVVQRRMHPMASREGDVRRRSLR